jgi:Lar family restriction alleviation protein
MSEKLLPCPFCGGIAHIYEQFSAIDDVEILCNSCGASGGSFNVDDGEPRERSRNRKAAIEHWNKRVQP